MPGLSGATHPVSVIVPVYKARPERLRRLSDSLRDQGAAEVVVILDDDSPPEATEDLLSEVPNLRVLVSEGQGAGMARNQGAAAATQPWLTFLDHDDWWPPEFLAALLAKADGGVLGYDNEVWTERDGEAVSEGESLFGRAGWEPRAIASRDADLLLEGFPIIKLLVNRSTFLAVGGFRPLYAVQDFDLVWRLLAAGETIDQVTEPAGAYLVHPEGITGTIGTDARAYIRAQHSWMKVWFSMARSDGLPPGVRFRAALKGTKVAIRSLAKRLRDRLLR